MVLGCTELSLLKSHLPQQQLFVDSLEVLAYQTILACGKTPIGLLECEAKGEGQA